VLQSDRVVWNIHDPHLNGGDPPEAKSWFMRTDRPTNKIKEIASVTGNDYLHIAAEHWLSRQS
jgi:hypothetical protein